MFDSRKMNILNAKASFDDSINVQSSGPASGIFRGIIILVIYLKARVAGIASLPVL